jgi:hypothetical protein
MGPRKPPKRRGQNFSNSAGGRFQYLSRLYMIRGRSETLDRMVTDMHRDLAVSREPPVELPDAELSEGEWRQALARERYVRDRGRRGA